MTGKYRVKVIICRNCSFRELDVEIPKGKTIEKWIEENLICSNCGCNKREYLAT